jgi:uncharacterized membrane protein HdeD (DUF308 family)
MRDDEPSISSSVSMREELARLGKNWVWLLVSGMIFIILGIAAYVWPVASTVTLTLALGWLFVVGGFVRVVQAIQLRQHIGTGWRVFDALLSLVVGVLLLRYPGGGMLAVAIAMTFFFFMSAVTKSTVAFGTRPLPGSGWAFVSAIASLVLGIYMIATFPVSAAWVPGALLGIDFVFYGISMIGFSFNMKKLHREIGEVVGPPGRRAA